MKLSNWRHQGFNDLKRGFFENGGDNLYVNANGAIETIHRTDLNNDGHVDFVMPNSHGYIERGPTWIYKQQSDTNNWIKQALPNDSGWSSLISDIDGDGYNDLVVVNGENGVTSELKSYIYWGGVDGLTGECTELSTVGAYDVEIVDINNDGLPDIIFPSAWVDHHNPGLPRYLNVYKQTAPRVFEDISEKLGIIGIGATSVTCADLTESGKLDLVVANYRKGFEYETDSFIYFEKESGFDTEHPFLLPTHFAQQVTTGDLNGDGFKEIIFCGGDQVWIYWNARGSFDPSNKMIIKVTGISTSFCFGSLHAIIKDIDKDGNNELILATQAGVEIRSSKNLQKVETLIEMSYCMCIYAADLNDDGYDEIIASRYEDGKTYETESAIFWNGINGFHKENVTWLPTSGAVGCIAGHLNSDDRHEIIFNNTMKGYSQKNTDFPVFVYPSEQDGTFLLDKRVDLPADGGSHSYVIADFDLDGYPDLAITTINGLRIFTGGPDGCKPDRYYDLPRGTGQTAASYVLTADINRDGWLDLIMEGYTYDDKPETMASSTYIFYGSKQGFSKDNSSVIPTFCAGNAVHLADINNDGYLEFLYGDKRGYVAIYKGGPEGFSIDRMCKIPLKDTDTAYIASINSADLNGDGWLDLVVSVMGHYLRKTSGFFIIYGGKDGFDPEKVEFHETGATNLRISMSDINKDGYLDLLVPFYSTQYSRELPARIYYGKSNGFDFCNPLLIPCNSSCAFTAIDVTDNGYPDVFITCHRDDFGHQVDSVLLFNGSKGLDLEHPKYFPGLGPHGATTRDFGNAKTRGPYEIYISPPHELFGIEFRSINWTADVPSNVKLKFQLRIAKSKNGLKNAVWKGPNGVESYYEKSGQNIMGLKFKSGSIWIQYKAIFFIDNGCTSPKLYEVIIDLN